MIDPEHHERLANELTNNDQLRLEGFEEHHTQEATVHELPFPRHRVNHDTFNDDAHAATIDPDSVVVQLGPFLKRVKNSPPDISA